MRQLLVLLSINFLKSSESVETFNEKAWMDIRGKDHFFDYAEVAEANNYYYYNTRASDLSSYNSNVDLGLFVADDDVR